MSVALLVLGYRAPTCLSAAAPIYKAAGFEIFVHVDAKADLEGYQSAMGSQAENCIFIPNRQKIFWAGFNMVRAELALLMAALEQNRNLTNFVLISDDTFPLLPVSQLQNFLSQPVDRVMLRRLPPDDLFISRYRRFFFLDHIATSLLGRPIETSSIDDDFLSNISRLSGLKSIGKKEIDLFYGSQWWSLTRQSAELVLSHYERDAHLTMSFEYSAVPDEMFIQTLIGNFSDKNLLRAGCVFVDWTRNPRPFAFARPSDLPVKLGPEYAFLRKIVPNREVLQHLQAKCGYASS